MHKPPHAKLLETLSVRPTQMSTQLTPLLGQPSRAVLPPMQHSEQETSRLGPPGPATAPGPPTAKVHAWESNGFWIVVPPVLVFSVLVKYCTSALMLCPTEDNVQPCVLCEYTQGQNGRGSDIKGIWDLNLPPYISAEISSALL